jgi:hypothetical protein
MAKKIRVWDGTKWEDVSSSLPVALIDHSHGIDTKGDLLVGSSSGTLTKISVGSDGSVLLASSTSSTGLVWTNNIPSPTLSGIVNVTGDINLSAVNAVGSINDEFALIIMGAI